MAYRVPLMRPYLTEGIRARVLEVLESGYWTEGPVTRELEAAFREYLGCPHALAMTSCTTGLDAALRCLEIGPGDEVLVPDFTYPATASAVLLLGASVVLVDVDPETMLVDYDALEDAVGPRTKAMIPVSIFGNPLDQERLGKLARDRSLGWIEDAACALGAAFQGERVGSQADISVFSMHPRKFITTGEGGMVTLRDPERAAWIDSFKHFGMAAATDRAGTCFEIAGTNYKLSNLLAAVGLEQMQEIDGLLERRRALAASYDRLLEGVDGVRIPRTTPEGTHSYQSYCVLVPERDRVLAEMRAAGIEAQIGTYALHQHPAFREGERVRHHGELSGSLQSFQDCLTLPLFDGLAEEQQEDVVETLRQTLQGI